MMDILKLKNEDGTWTSVPAIQGKDGTNGTDGKDGTNGTNGTNGISPTATVTQTTTGATVTITDTNGTTTAEIKNGKDGSEADVPIATVDAVGKVKPDGTTITITEDGTISASSLQINVSQITSDNVTLQNNTIYRGGSLSSISFGLPALTALDVFDVEIDITIGSDPMVVTAPVNIDWMGDNIVDGTWTPVKDKRYALFIYWDGVRYRAISQSQKLQA